MEYQQKYSIPVGGREGQVAHVYYLENPAHGYGYGYSSISALLHPFSAHPVPPSHRKLFITPQVDPRSSLSIGILTKSLGGAAPELHRIQSRLDC